MSVVTAPRRRSDHLMRYGICALGKKKVMHVLDDKREDRSCLNVFEKKDASHDDVAEGGERLLLKLYGAEKGITLDKQRHLSSMQKVGCKSVASDGFQLKLYPPKLAAAKYHSYQTYLTVQGWLVTLILGPHTGAVSSVTDGVLSSTATGHA